MPVNRRPSARAARPVVPVPQNGSSTCRPACTRHGCSGSGSRSGRRRSAARGRAGSGSTTRHPGYGRWVPRGATAIAVPPGGNDLARVAAVLRPWRLPARLGGYRRAGRRRGGGAAGGPDIAERRLVVPAVRARRRMGCPDRVEIEPVVAGLDQQEDQLVPAVQPVTNRLGHRVGLVPHDRVTDDPAVVLQRERYPPGQAEEVLSAQAWRGARPGAVRCRHAGRLVCAAGRVGVSEVEPARPVVSQDAARLGEHVAQRLDIGCRGRARGRTGRSRRSRAWPSTAGSSRCSRRSCRASRRARRVRRRCALPMWCLRHVSMSDHRPFVDL